MLELGPQNENQKFGHLAKEKGALLKRGLVPATRDTFVHYLFGTLGNEHILLSFLNAVLHAANRPLVSSVEMLNPFDPATFVSEKYTILDVKATDKSGKIFAIEFQTAEHVSFAQRILYYWARVYSRQLKEGEKYKTLSQVISVAITGFVLFKALPELFNSFYLTAERHPEYVLTDDLQIHALEVTVEKINQIPNYPKPFQSWLNLFYYADKKSEEEMKVLLQGEPAVEEAYTQYQKFCESERLRRIDDARQMYLHDYNSDVGAAFERGELKGKVGSIVTVLKARFHQVPETLMQSLNERVDLVALESLVVYAATCSSLSDFEKELE